MGSPFIAAWVAHAAFWILLLYGSVTGELTGGRIVLFVLLWIAGLIALPHAPYTPARAMFSSYVAILDIGLVFVIFKGDVRIA